MKPILFIPLLALPNVASAFPIAAGVMGAGTLGIMALPFLIIVAAMILLLKGSKTSAALVASIGIPMLLMAALEYDDSNDSLLSANLFNQAETSFLNQAVPFNFLSNQLQMKSKQAVWPAEFVRGLEDGHFKALKISAYPSLFTSQSGLTVQAIRDDKDKLLSAVEGLGGRVVLVDEYGGISGTIAEEALKHFGINLGFLVGGTKRLSQYGWTLNLSQKGEEILVDEYQNWLKENPEAVVLSITTDREFVQDGWMFGDQTLTLADFISSFSEIALLTQGKKVFLASFETHDSGATPVVVKLLSSAGVDVTYVAPSPAEILVKPAYFQQYENHERLVGLNDAKRYIRARSDVVFLDFSESQWKLSFTKQLEGRYLRLPMTEVAAGGLEKFVDELDPSKTYIGLAFDRRTAYHSLLAGEALSERGVAWLGRFTLPNVLTEELLNNEDLTSSFEIFTSKLKTDIADMGKMLASINGSAIFFLFNSLIVYGCIRSRSQIRKSLYLAIISLSFYQLHLTANDYSLNWTVNPYWLMVGAVLAGLAAALWPTTVEGPISSASALPEELPPKAALLNQAAAKGAKVIKGTVFSHSDDVATKVRFWDQGRYIVRSAAANEASCHGETAGIYRSIVVNNLSEIPEAVASVIEHQNHLSGHGKALVQRFCEAKYFGVAQLMSNGSSDTIVCEYGSWGSVTDGSGIISSAKISTNEVHLSGKSIRVPAQLLLRLESIGAHSIEFATNGSEITLLQVNADEFRACAEKKLKALGNKRVAEAESAHSDPISAALIAAMAAPGSMFAYGNRRFFPATSRLNAIATAIDDAAKLGLLHKPSFASLIKIMEGQEYKLGQGVNCSGSVDDTISLILDAVNDISQTLGRANRLATTAMMLGITGRWSTSPQNLPTSIIGSKIRDGKNAEWKGHSVAPLIGLNLFSNKLDFTADALPTKAIPASSPAAYVKDVSTAMIMSRLESLSAGIEHVLVNGGAQVLLNRLNAQAGYWDALQLDMEREPTFMGAGSLKDLMANNSSNFGVMRIPKNGIEGCASTPESKVEDGILFIESCQMDYFDLLDISKAVVVKQGAITSHLMQHAAFKGKPVVIGAPNFGQFKRGDQIRINKEGLIEHA